MEMFMRSLEFILNNFFKVILIFISLVFALYFSHKIVKETRLNRSLAKFQKFMRETQATMKPKRLAGLSALMIVPTLVAFSVLFFSRAPQFDFDNHIYNVSSEQDILSIHQQFQQKMSNTGLRSVSPEHSDNIIQGLDGVNSQERHMGLPDLIQVDSEFLYILKGDVMSVVRKDVNDIGVEINISINYDRAHDRMFYPLALYVEEDIVIVVGNTYEYSYLYNFQLGFRPELGTETDIIVQVFDKNDGFNLLREYVISGALAHVMKLDKTLIIVSAESVPFDENQVQLNDYLPHITFEGVTYQADYTEISYIQGTNPEGFLGIYHIDLQNGMFERKVIFGDTHSTIISSHNAVYIISESVKFFDASEMFVINNPISEVNTSIVRFAIDNHRLVFHSTSMVNGKPHLSRIWSDNDDYLAIVSLSDPSNPYVYRLSIIENGTRLLSKIDDFTKGKKLLQFSINGLCGISLVGSEGSVLLGIDLSDTSRVSMESELGVTNQLLFHKLSETQLLSIGFNQLFSIESVDRVQLSLYDIGSNCALSLQDTIYISYEDYGIVSSEAVYHQNTLAYDYEHGLIIFPYNTFDYSPSVVHRPGLVVLNAIHEEGLIIDTHIQHSGETDVWSRYRGVVVDDYLFSISNHMLQVAHIDDIDTPLYIIQLYENN